MKVNYVSESDMDVDILVVGAGLSGLHTAYELEKGGYNYRVVEARNRIGGRVLTQPYSSSYIADEPLSVAPLHTDDSAFDLGPSWFWPGQSRLEKLANELNLSTDIFEQHSQGSSVYEDAQGNVEKGFFGMSMEGSYRLRGGISQFTSGLAQHIPQEKILLNTAVTDLSRNSDTVTATITNDGKEGSIRSRIVILALPPRNAIANIQFKPNLESNRVSDLNSFPTWMAAQAKFVAVYEKPFWRDQELSGDAMSQLGPLREIHDASTNDDAGRKSHYALFGFVGIPTSSRKDTQQQTIEACTQQLVRLFGNEAASPLHVSWKDWSTEQYTSTPEDQLSGGHADHSLSDVTEWNKRLIWSGTETAEVDNEHNNGYLEGALESSIRSLKLIKDSLKSL